MLYCNKIIRDSQAKKIEFKIYDNIVDFFCKMIYHLVMDEYFIDSEKFEFLPTNMALDDGFIGYGGDLSVKRLVLAYRSGIFPWYDKGDPILWWSPDPRFVLFPQNVHVSESMRKILRREIFEIRLDTHFTEVMKHCSSAHGRTWILPEMIEAYTRLHKAGYAHSVEVYQNDALVGGLYGVRVGNVFCGESMFSLVSNSSKTAFIVMARLMLELGIVMVDCQFQTDHLSSLGGQNITRDEYIRTLTENMTDEQPYLWTDLLSGRTTRDFV